MKISCLIASLRLGGAERQLSGLSAMLHSAGHDVELLTYREGSFYAPVLEAAGIAHVRLRGGGDLQIVRELASHCRERGTEVLISFLAGTNIKACLAHRLEPSFRLIVSERNVNRRCLPHDRFRFSLYGREAAAVVCNSHAQETFMRLNCPGLRDRLHAIPNYTDLERFSPVPHGASSPFRVVTLARLDPRKNPEGLMRAVASCPQLRLDWYGDGSERYRIKCERSIRSLGLDGRFFLHPARQDVENVYREADAFCLPSFYEGTPNALAEALACGLPAAVSDVSDNSLYVHPGENGFLFDPSAPETIASALASLAALGDDTRQLFAARSRKIAQEAFGTERFAGSYLELLEKL